MPEYNFDISKVRSLEEQNKFLFNLGNHVVMDSPAPGAINVVTTPLLEWTDTLSIFADRYKVEVSTNDEGTFDAGIFLTVRTTSQSYQIVATLDAATTYYWRVTPLVFLSQTVNTVTDLVINDSNFEIEENNTKEIFYTIETVGSPDESVTLSLSDETNFSITDNGGSATLSEIGTPSVGSTVDVTITSVSNPLATDTKTYTVVSASGAVTEQDSVQGDFEALQAFYNATLGNDPDIPVYASTSERPTAQNMVYPYMALVGGQIHFVKYSRTHDIEGWEVYGTPWQDKTGWDDMTAQTMGDAVGVEVDSNGRVITLDVQKITSEVYLENGQDLGGRITKGNGLIGKLVPDLKNLKKLKKINIKQNFFFGSIPAGLTNSWPEIGRISLGGQRSEVNLERRGGTDSAVHRKVYYNDDHINAATRGKEDGSTNRFRTHLEDISNLPNLELFEVRRQFTLGTLPEFTNCPSLKGILIDYNRGSNDEGISGGIPSSWYNLNPMKVYLGEPNVPRFSGTITSTPNWTDLSIFFISGHDFTGKAPAFTSARDKRYYAVSDNLFSDIDMSEFFNGDNSELNGFAISGNPYDNVQLPSDEEVERFPTFPEDRSQGTSGEGYFWISTLRFSGCGFVGEIPDWIVQLPRVVIFDLSFNSFTGGFPAVLLNNDRIKSIRLNDNNLSGTLPAGTWASSAMLGLHIGNNNFEGEIPVSWASIFQDASGDFVDQMRGFTVNGNNLEGVIPDWGKYCPTQMLQYHFDNNRFVFADILEHKTEIENAIGSVFKFGNQKPFGTEQTITRSVGQSFTVDYSDKAHLDDSYQWKKDGNDIANTTDTLSIASVDSGDAGFYTLEITNSSLSEISSMESNYNELIIE